MGGQLVEQGGGTVPSGKRESESAIVLSHNDQASSKFCIMLR